MWTALIIGSIVAACIGAAGGFGVAYLNKQSQEETNEMNRQINETNNAFNAEEAEKQREFEAEMSNTAVQRKAADLQAAGFNPMLAVTSGTASTPGAYAATSSGNAQMKAVDFSPMAQVSANLGHMVTSAAYIKRIQHICENDPQTANALAKMAKSINSSVTGAGKMDSLASISPEDIEMSNFMRSTSLWK